MRIDLHHHSLRSDGTCLPEELAQRAAREGVVLAITDHDRLAPGLAGIIRGAELSTTVPFHTYNLLMHLLVYVPADLPSLLATDARMQRRRGLMQASAYLLNRCGLLPTVIPDVELIPDNAFPSLIWIAEYIFSLGGYRNQQQVWDRWLLPNQGATTGVDLDGSMSPWAARILEEERPALYALLTNEDIGLERTVYTCHAANALVVLAHPNAYSPEVVERLAAEGWLDGIEGYSDRYGESSHALALARRYGLLITAGSDGHGADLGGRLLNEIPELANTLAAFEARGIWQPQETERSH